MRALVFILLLSLAIAGCGGRAYVVEDYVPTTLAARAESKSKGDVDVRTTVLTSDEAESIFGIDLYSTGVQPVWLQITNGREAALRYAPVSTDREYYAPLEIPYVNKRGFSADARKRMDARFHKLAMPRQIDAGATVDGFVFTHFEPGTKGFNIDVFGHDVNFRFTFFITPPGFVPDHAAIETSSLYADESISDFGPAEFLDVLQSRDCCSGSAQGAASGSPVNVAFIGHAYDVLYALIRARWREVGIDEKTSEIATDDYYLYGRKQDATLRYDGRDDTDGFYELRIWRAPHTVNGQPVWLAQLRHFFDHRWTPSRPDPDLDNAQAFLLQNLWYSSVLLKYGIVETEYVVPIEARVTDFQGGEYFTSGLRTALWLSDKPISLLDVEHVSTGEGDND